MYIHHGARSRAYEPAYWTAEWAQINLIIHQCRETSIKRLVSSGIGLLTSIQSCRLARPAQLLKSGLWATCSASVSYYDVMPVSLLWLLNSTSNLATLIALVLHVLRTTFGLFFYISLVCIMPLCIIFVCFVMYFIAPAALVRIKLLTMIM